MFTLVRVLGVAIGNYHFSKRQSIEDASFTALVIIRDIVQDDAFAIIESDMNFPIFPLDNSAINFKIDAFRLCDVNRFDILPISTFCFNRCWVIIIWWCLVDRSSYRRNIDMDDLLRVTIEDWGEIQGVGILAVIDMWTVVH